MVHYESIEQVDFAGILNLKARESKSLSTGDSLNIFKFTHM